MFTDMQQEYFRNATHRWNVKTGATRSGKTYMDYYAIPKRIRSVAGREGAVLLLGHTQGTLLRNVIYPLQELWGDELVKPIRTTDNTAMLFGERCYCLGADKKTSVDKIRGMSVKYCYGDEVVTWNEAVFDMLKSRLDKPYSRFDGTCNPEGRQHWFKKFLDKGVPGGSVRVSGFTIDDNPALPKGFAQALKREYAGTVYYDRFILGLWKNAEGVIYRQFADCPEKFICKMAKNIIMADMGVDFGGNGSATAFNVTGYTAGYRQIYTLEEYYRKGIMSPAELERDFADFVKRVRKKYPMLRDIYCDSAEQVLIRGLQNAAIRERLPVEIHNARKGEISQRIRFYNAVLSDGRYKILAQCKNTIAAFSQAVWEGGSLDRRLDDGSVNIDSLDAQEYSTERRMKDILDVMR